MKKFLPSVLLLSVFLLMCGCSDNEKQIALNAYNCQLNIQCDAWKYKGTLIIEGKDEIRYKVCSPTELDGIEFILSDDELDISLSDIRIDSDFAAINSPVAEMLTVISFLHEKPLFVSPDGFAELTVEDTGKNYLCEIDCDRGLVTGISNDKVNAKFVY